MGNKVLSFDCGCQFDITEGEGTTVRTGLDNVVNIPRIKFDPDNVPLTCPATWELLSNGATKGVWQLESPLGKGWAKRLKPANMEELAALTALLRPGCINALSGDPPKSMTQRYVDRKLNLEPVTYLHPALEGPTGKTYGVLVYQEQAMQIAQAIAGFDLQKADVLRKAIGKKKADLMAQVEKEFIEGCKQAGIVSEEQAAEIFGWVKESQKYSFNKSHAVSYGLLAYRTAYCKAHFPVPFYVAYLRGSAWKQDTHEEIHELVQDARLANIDIYGPDLRQHRRHFHVKETGPNPGIYCGLADIKQVGHSAVLKVSEGIEEVESETGKKLADWKWVDYLFYFSDKIPSTVNIAFISVGAIDYVGVPRIRMLHEFDAWNQLTAKEKKWVAEYHKTQPFTNLAEALKTVAPTKKMGGGCHDMRRSEKVANLYKAVANPASKMEDSAHWIAFQEEKFLGISFTCSRVDGIEEAIVANCTCRDFMNGEGNDYIVMAVEVDRTKEHKVKNGKSAGSVMAFIDVSDSTGPMSCVCFPRQWAEFSSLLEVGNIVILRGKRDKDRGSLIIEKVQQL